MPELLEFLPFGMSTFREGLSVCLLANHGKDQGERERETERERERETGGAGKAPGTAAGRGDKERVVCRWNLAT